ncbi:hypothetical protein [Wolbachia endosymbiont of Folsomia candida]|uniref:hypothetical protein n=1 Tax=Wolbachia endosymbiont of Folsomia candida TaxID=169402 RepID=UPI000B5E22A7|nr:hypothetical protein [Wolbachia endosymbiont of Folsomia candida]APR98971.1 hypothetical protein ASM33_07220 [Wolbachia endosymbiont of Folsomia candida]
MKKIAEEEKYQDFLEHLKNFITASHSGIAKHRIRKHRKCSPSVKEIELSKNPKTKGSKKHVDQITKATI